MILLIKYNESILTFSIYNCPKELKGLFIPIWYPLNIGFSLKYIIIPKSYKGADSDFWIKMILFLFLINVLISSSKLELKQYIFSILTFSKLISLVIK